MNPSAPRRLHPLLEAAVQRVKLCARNAVERTVESLGLAALATHNVFQRDGLLGAQYELNRKSSFFATAFNESIDERVLREVAPPQTGSGLTNWDALSLVDDQEVERKVSAERFGLEIAHSCEWELRELDAYMGSLLGSAAGPDGNPLRPEVLGMALMRGIEATSERPEVRSLLLSELGRILASEMRATYTAIVGDLRKAGVQPAGLSVRPTTEHSRFATGYDSLHDGGGDAESTLSPGSSGYASRSRSMPPTSRHHSLHGGPTTGRSRLGQGSSRYASGFGHGGTFGQVDAQLMSLIKRLAHVDPVAVSDAAELWDAPTTAAPLPPNLIRAHREELRQMAHGKFDHMVIDIVGTLFDQILSDPKVPPQMARQIGRLQLPVLRAALGDQTFFSSRRHPVRRFINRIASLGAAFDDYGSDEARRFLARVRELVEAIVEGDFEQIGTYEQQLDELERFIAELARESVQQTQGDPTSVLAHKETELRLIKRYATQLETELRSLEGPDFVREFLTEVWSQVLMRAARKHGDDSEAFQRLRAVARDLFMSVQPKGMPAQRKEFLQQLPRLMQGLNEGMDLIGWPEAARKAFFGLLLPAHAESLKGQGLRTLDFNMLAHKVDGAFKAPLPKAADLPPPDANLPVLDDAIVEPGFSEEEARQVGLLQESQVDWSATVPPAGPAEGGEPEAPITAVDIDITGLPPPEPVEETSGEGLADNVQLGCAYQMHVDGGWHKVKLAHVSDARTFYVFSRGERHKRTISLTHRMLVKLCETGRMRAFENAYLLERATARARRQLSQLRAGAAA
jgi:hypothetical protein